MAMFDATKEARCVCVRVCACACTHIYTHTCVCVCVCLHICITCELMEAVKKATVAAAEEATCV
jgi:hypothetical protein